MHLCSQMQKYRNRTYGRPRFLKRDTRAGPQPVLWPQAYLGEPRNGNGGEPADRPADGHHVPPG